MNLNHIKKMMDRRKNSRKGQNGRALIIGGSEEFPGAVAMAGVGALRAGCDIVTVASPEKVAWAVNSFAPDLITQKIRKAFTVKLAKDLVKEAERLTNSVYILLKNLHN